MEGKKERKRKREIERERESYDLDYPSLKHNVNPQCLEFSRKTLNMLPDIFLGFKIESDVKGH